MQVFACDTYKYTHDLVLMLTNLHVHARLHLRMHVQTPLGHTRAHRGLPAGQKPPLCTVRPAVHAHVRTLSTHVWARAIQQSTHMPGRGLLVPAHRPSSSAGPSTASAAAVAAAATAAEIMQPYQWSLPRMGAMPGGLCVQARVGAQPMLLDGPFDAGCARACWGVLVARAWGV